MFFLKQLSRDLLLHPMHFGPKLHDIIRLRLIEEVEGTSMGKYGYVITVTEVRDEDIGKGVIQDNSGFVCFNIRYRAILFRPFKNQVLDAVVTVVNQLGFFADVGPLQVFVSRHAMPTDLNNGYDHENNAWISDDREVEIRKGCGVRLKIMGVSVDVTEIVRGRACVRTASISQTCLTDVYVCVWFAPRSPAERDRDYQGRLFRPHLLRQLLRRARLQPPPRCSHPMESTAMTSCSLLLVVRQS
jgi:DNA-directed RNA polymerase II subunit RPB7